MAIHIHSQSHSAQEPAERAHSIISGKDRPDPGMSKLIEKEISQLGTPGKSLKASHEVISLSDLPPEKTGYRLARVFDNSRIRCAPFIMFSDDDSGDNTSDYLAYLKDSDSSYEKKSGNDRSGELKNQRSHEDSDSLSEASAESSNDGGSGESDSEQSASQIGSSVARRTGRVQRRHSI